MTYHFLPSCLYATLASICSVSSSHYSLSIYIGSSYFPSFLSFSIKLCSLFIYCISLAICYLCTFLRLLFLFLMLACYLIPSRADRSYSLLSCFDINWDNWFLSSQGIDSMSTSLCVKEVKVLPSISLILGILKRKNELATIPISTFLN